MKKLAPLLLFLMAGAAVAQTNDALKSHYEDYYRQMRLQGDRNGIISALTHLNLLSPSKARLDTLAFIYADSNQHLQALNTIGIEKNESDSDLAVQVKALSLKALNQPKRSIEQFEILYKRNPNPYVAYELADLKIQTGDKAGASTNIEYGIANATDDMKHAFFERQQPYEASLKAAFIHLKALIAFDNKIENIDAAIKLIDEALALDPTFNLASLSKQALEMRKKEASEGAGEEKK